MNQTIQKLGLAALVCLLVAGCHSSSSTAPAAQTAAHPPAAAPIAAVLAPPTKLVCKGFSKDVAGGIDFIESDALFVLMQSKLGGWTSCQNKDISKTDSITTVTFPHGGVMTIGQYPASDASTEEAVLDAGSSLTRDEAVKILRQDQPPDGCGVDWSKLSTAGGPTATGDFTSSGTTCSLDVHVKMVNGSVVGFGFAIAA